MGRLFKKVPARKVGKYFQGKTESSNREPDKPGAANAQGKRFTAK